MSAEEELKRSDELALDNNQRVASSEQKYFNTRVSGKNLKTNKKKKKINGKKSLGVILLVVVIFAAAVVLFGSGQVMPTLMLDNMIDATNMQGADNIESNMLVFQQCLYNGKVPEERAKILKENNVLVGYIDDTGKFVENAESGKSSVLKMKDKIISANDFIKEINDNKNTELYKAFKESIYNGAMDYFDEAAEKVFEEIGTSRNNYDRETNFEDTVNEVLGKGSDIDINTVSLVEKTRQNKKTGETETYYDYEKNGEDVNSNNEGQVLISEVSDKNLAKNSTDATLNSADALTVADTMSKEQRSSLFFAVLMENVSKMKAGEGNDAKVSDLMNYLYKKSEIEVVDVKTGEVKKVVGSPMDSPSLYAILTGKKVNEDEVKNYSNERILKTVENQLGVNQATNSINGTVASSSNKTTGSIGRLISEKMEQASTAVLDLTSPTMNNSLHNNSIEDIKGVAAGEFLAEGAVNLGRKLASTSGATAGDEEAILAYSNLNSAILALDAEVDRMERSPFDITSKNTFLGTIIYNFAMSFNSSNLININIVSNAVNLASFTGKMATNLMPKTFADSDSGYLASFGECERYEQLYNAKGTTQCDEIAIFDTSTLKDPFNDPGFIEFVEHNTKINSSGQREIIAGSDLETFIKYRNRKTPLGVKDGEILEERLGGTSSSDIEEMIKASVNASEEDNDVATGKAFINSASNPKWQVYKYAQRYVSLARAVVAQGLYSEDKKTYVNIKFFEGYESPVSLLKY